MLDMEGTAAGLLGRLEELVKDALAGDLTAAQLRQALDMSLADEKGPLTGTLLVRRPVETSERALWYPPSSLFMADGFPEPNKITHLRRHVGWSVERLAARMGVSPTELALWEHGKLPPRRSAMELAEMFGVALDHLLGCRDWNDPLVCARCGTDAPGNPERYQRGWDVAGGVDLVCPDCLTPGDLDWPSDAEVA